MCVFLIYGIVVCIIIDLNLMQESVVELELHNEYRIHIDFSDFVQTTNLSKEEFVHILRRQSTGFSRGSSKYRGVTLHKCGRWEARMGQFLGKK